MATKKKATKKKASRKKAARKKFAKRIAKKATGKKRGRGQPTKYRAEFLELGFKLALAGMDDSEIAECLDVAVSTLNNWKNWHPEFLDAIRRGKTMADAEMAHALYLRGKGFISKELKAEYVPDEKEKGQLKLVRQTEITKELPPDTAAAGRWLGNRQRDKWQERKTLEVERPLADYSEAELYELTDRLIAERDQMLGIESGDEPGE